MTTSATIQKIFHFVWFSSLVIAVGLVPGMRAKAQDKVGIEVEGYVTAVHSPNGFDVNGRHVTVSSATEYALPGSKASKSGDELKDEIQLGAFVHVDGPKTGDTIDARMIEIRDNSDKKLDGFGEIDTVVSGGDEPVFQADGFRIRITSATQVSYHGDLKLLADVNTGVWVHYTGKRDKTAEVVATRAEFFAPRNGSAKEARANFAAMRVYQDESGFSKPELLDADGHLMSVHTKVRYSDAGGNCGWHRVPADLALQERVRRVGERVIPSFQRQLAAGDPGKIPFRFYAVDDAKIRSDIFCNDGLVLVPRQVVERLKNEDQLAALLADGVAFYLQVRSARVLAEFRDLLGIEIAGYVAAVFAPGVDIATDIGAGVAQHEIEMRMQEQRGRMALAMMADAGYDPWQAPEAWRLVAPKELPSDADLLKYPSRSGYQLGILSLQYKRGAGNAQAAPTESAPSENR